MSGKAGRVRALLRRDGPGCRYCDDEFCETTLDHVVPRSKGGTDALWNLVLACAPCNTDKGSIDLDDFASPERAASIRESLAKSSAADSWSPMWHYRNQRQAPLAVVPRPAKSLEKTLAPPKRNRLTRKQIRERKAAPRQAVTTKGRAPRWDAATMTLR